MIKNKNNNIINQKNLEKEKLKKHLRNEKIIKSFVLIGVSNFILMATGVYVNNPADYFTYTKTYFNMKYSIIKNKLRK